MGLMCTSQDVTSAGQVQHSRSDCRAASLFGDSCSKPVGMKGGPACRPASWMFRHLLMGPTWLSGVAA